MEESRLTQFDEETLMMIESVTGLSPIVTENEKYFEINMRVKNNSNRVAQVAANAVLGRFGKRILDVAYTKNAIFLRGVTFYVCYEDASEAKPEEIRSEYRKPDESAGHLYCRRLLEVRAVVVERDNMRRLFKFTGGGVMTVPRKPGELALYSFPTENGVMMDVPEGWAVVAMPDGKFSKIDGKEFAMEFERKDGNSAGRGFNGNRLFRKMCRLFGTDLQKRFLKLSEEYNELAVEADGIITGGIMPHNLSDLLDELADVNAVLFHIAALLGYSQGELLEMAYKKIRGREDAPGYMRKHPHRESQTPGDGEIKGQS